MKIKTKMNPRKISKWFRFLFFGLNFFCLFFFVTLFLTFRWYLLLLFATAQKLFFFFLFFISVHFEHFYWTVCAPSLVRCSAYVILVLLLLLYTAMPICSLQLYVSISNSIRVLVIHAHALYLDECIFLSHSQRFRSFRFDSLEIHRVHFARACVCVRHVSSSFFSFHTELNDCKMGIERRVNDVREFWE